MCLRKYLSKFHLFIVNQYLKLRGSLVRKEVDTLAFIPHGGMYANGYDLFNYKSDNCLAFLHYFIERFGSKYKYRLACDIRQYDELSKRIKLELPDIDIKCFPFFGLNLRPDHYQELMRSSVIFTAEGYPLPFKSPEQKIVFLSYFIPFKDDYKYHHSVAQENYDRLFDLCISSSLIYSNIVAHTYHVEFGKFKVLGFPRDDELLTPKYCPSLEEEIKKAVDYEVKKVFLYSPTHRDYEECSDAKRSVLGFGIDKARMEKFLRESGILIICKQHSLQNEAVISHDMPDGMMIHQATNAYGLCELMQRADVLITDYTSTYFDYLLLDRPVLFNFYDYQVYQESRGFSYDPLEPILAGDVFTDEKSFYETCNQLLKGEDKYGEKRRWVRDLQHKYTDAISSDRIYNYLVEHQVLLG